MLEVVTCTSNDSSVLHAYLARSFHLVTQQRFDNPGGQMASTRMTVSTFHHCRLPDLKGDSTLAPQDLPACTISESDNAIVLVHTFPQYLLPVLAILHHVTRFVAFFF